LGSSGVWLYVSNDTPGLLTTASGVTYSNPLAQIMDANILCIHNLRASEL